MVLADTLNDEYNVHCYIAGKPFLNFKSSLTVLSVIVSANSWHVVDCSTNLESVCANARINIRLSDGEGNKIQNRHQY